MGSTSPAFTLLPAEFEDIDTLLDVYFHAFEADGVYPHLYPGLTWAAKIAFEASGPKRVFREQPWAKLWKVVERESKKIVAWARWHYPRVLSEAEREEDGDPDLFDQSIPEGSNVTLCEDLFEKLEWAEHTFVDREHGLFLNYLIVHPDYQGRGLSKLLLNVGLDEADRIGASCFVVSTVAGEAVYRKCGFVEIDRFVSDVRPWGGELVPWFCMRREPRGKKAEGEIRN